MNHGSDAHRIMIEIESHAIRVAVEGYRRAIAERARLEADNADQMGPIHETERVAREHLGDMIEQELRSKFRSILDTQLHISVVRRYHHAAAWPHTCQCPLCHNNP